MPRIIHASHVAHLARYKPVGDIQGDLAPIAEEIATRLRTGAAPTLFVVVIEGHVYAPRDSAPLAFNVEPEQLVGVFKGAIPVDDIADALRAWRDEHPKASRAA